MTVATEPDFLASDRLASLSDTMFGVAMTLLATTLVPVVEGPLPGGLAALPGLRGALYATMMSFAISGSYWISQQRRLAMTTTVSGWQTVLHLVFLFLVVMLPVTTGLFGRLGPGRTSIIVYGTHLVLLSVANLMLWVGVHRRVVAHGALLGSSLSLAFFVAGLGIGLFRPVVAQYLWFCCFAGLPLGRALERCRKAA